MSSWHLGVKGLQGKTLNLEILNPQQATVQDLKGLIYQRDSELPPFEQRLVYMNEELQDDQRLCSYPDIIDGSTLYLIRLIPFQLFIKGMDGTTFTIRVPSRKPETYSVSHLKKLVQEKSGVRPDEQRLQFGGRQLEDRMTLGDYNIQNLNTLHLVSRLRGGLASNQTIQISSEPCIITGVVGSSVKMPCGHAISPKALGDYGTAEIQKHKTNICCPRCSKEWPLRDLRRYGGLSSTELKSIEEGLTRNFCQSMPGVVACRGCGMLCLQITSSDVECSSCTKKRHNDDSATVKLLGECPVKKIYQSSCPSIRACPKCGKLIEHIDGCRRVSCDRCNTTFCFNCLTIRPPTAQAYYNCPDNCSTAARQTVISKW